MEQAIIRDRIDRELSNVSKLLSEIDDQLIKAEALRQSILKRAFSGQLVPQDPTDDPASVLLERIRSEKVKRAAGPTNGGNASRRKVNSRKRTTAA
jgi:type I restriction enzyme S subunit